MNGSRKKFRSYRSQEGARRRAALGMTLLELVVACAILITLAGAAVPLARVTLKRRQEADLRYALREMRDAVDRYKDAADRNLVQVKAGTEGYPPDLDTLVKGVQLAGAADRHVRFLRAIPVDPMTGQKDWGMRSVQDDPDTTSWGGQDVFDVYSRSQGTALDGTKYSDW
jgi:general secretion pathway protein G